MLKAWNTAQAIYIIATITKDRSLSAAKYRVENPASHYSKLDGRPVQNTASASGFPECEEASIFNFLALHLVSRANQVVPNTDCSSRHYTPLYICVGLINPFLVPQNCITHSCEPWVLFWGSHVYIEVDSVSRWTVLNDGKVLSKSGHV